MKRFFLLLLLPLLLTACAAPHTALPALSPVPTLTATMPTAEPTYLPEPSPSPTPTPLPTPRATPLSEVPYDLDDPLAFSEACTVTLSNGRTLTLRVNGLYLHGNGTSCEIYTVDVLENGILLQTIVPKEHQNFGEEHPYGEAWHPTEDLLFEDVNFDGIEDLGIQGNLPGSGGPWHLFFYWDDANSQYVHLLNEYLDKLDPENRIFTAAFKWNATSHTWTEYHITQDNQALPFRKTDREWSRAVDGYRIVIYELQDDEWIVISEEIEED